MVVIEGFKRLFAGRRRTLMPYPPEGAAMNIHDLLDRLLLAWAAYAGGVCGACAD